MRIISGSFGGRQFKSPPGHKTHPMSDKVRGAIFNILGDIEGLTMLDAFAGSGAVGFEAISRNAKSVTAIEVDISAHRTIGENAKALGMANRIKAIRANASGWSDNNPDAQYDLVICDPPYDNLQIGLLNKLVRHLKTEGVMVLSFPGGLDTPDIEGLETVANKNYGDAQLIFYKKVV